MVIKIASQLPLETESHRARITWWRNNGRINEDLLEKILLIKQNGPQNTKQGSKATRKPVHNTRPYTQINV